MTVDIGYVVDKYSGMIFKTAYTYLQNREDAEDVMQEVFIRYVRHQKDFNDEEHQKAWLLRVAINCSKSPLAVRKRNSDIEKKAAEVTKKSDNDFSELFGAVMSLPEKQRLCVHLFYYENYSIKEISKVTGFLTSTVKSHLFRAKQNLKEKLKGVYSDEHLEEL